MSLICLLQQPGRFKLPVAALVALQIALVGCASTEGLHSHNIAADVNDVHVERSLGGYSLSPAAWPSQDWWTRLGDPQLDALIDEALANSPDLTLADARARAAQSQVDQADARRLPTIGADSSVAAVRLPTTALPAPIGGHFQAFPAVYASFNWGIDLWGGKRAAWEATVGLARASDIDAHAARIMLSVNVTRAYAQLGYAFAQSDVAVAQLRRASASRDLVKQRVAAGIDNLMQVKQADAEVSTAAQQTAVATESVNSARIALAVLLGKGPDRGLDIARPRVLAPAALALPPNLPAELLGRRADLVAMRWRIEASSRNIAAVKTEFLPNLNLGAMAGFTSSTVDTLFSLPARFYEIAPALSLPLFDGGKRRGDLKDADANFDIAVAQYNSALIGALNEVADRLSSLRSLQVQIAAEVLALDATRQAWDLSQQRYKAGVGSYLDTLTVQQQLLMAEQRMAQLQAQQVDTSVRLVQSLGGGYNAGSDVVPPAHATTAIKATTTHIAGATP